MAADGGCSVDGNLGGDVLGAGDNVEADVICRDDDTIITHTFDGTVQHHGEVVFAIHLGEQDIDIDNVKKTLQLFYATWVGNVTGIQLIATGTVTRSFNVSTIKMEWSTIHSVMNSTETIPGSTREIEDVALTEV